MDVAGRVDGTVLPLSKCYHYVVESQITRKRVVCKCFTTMHKTTQTLVFVLETVVSLNFDVSTFQFRQIN